MNKNDFFAAIAFALEVDESIVTINLKIDDIPEWDSLGHLTILSHLDEITDGKAGEIADLGSLENLDAIWNAFVDAGIATDS
jgi:acyl carrier protein